MEHIRRLAFRMVMFLKMKSGVSWTTAKNQHFALREMVECGVQQKSCLNIIRLLKPPGFRMQKQSLNRWKKNRLASDGRGLSERLMMDSRRLDIPERKEDSIATM